jgi:hypothetical protein
LCADGKDVVSGRFADAGLRHRDDPNRLACSRKELDLISRRGARPSRVVLDDHPDIPGSNTLSRDVGREYDALKESEGHSLP